MKKLVKIFFLLICLTAFNFSLLSPAKAVFKQTPAKKEKFSKIPEVQQVLAVLDTELDVEKSKEGDLFIAKTIEDVLFDERNVLIPSESVLLGTVYKVKKPGFIHKNAYINISIETITSPEGEITVLDPPFINEIYKPGTKKLKDKLFVRLPASIASSGSSFILGQGTSIARSAVWGISIGAGIVGGVFSGLVMPDKDKTTAQTCVERALSSTPPGRFKSIVSKGKGFSLAPGEFINVHFDRKAIRLMMDDFSITNKEFQGS